MRVLLAPSRRSPLTITRSGHAEPSLVSCKAAWGDSCSGFSTEVSPSLGKSDYALKRRGQDTTEYSANTMPQAQEALANQCSLALPSFPGTLLHPQRGIIQTPALGPTFSALIQPRSGLSLQAEAFGCDGSLTVGPAFTRDTSALSLQAVMHMHVSKWHGHAHAHTGRTGIQA